MARMADGAPVENNKWQRGEFCMEPPPDAMENVAALFTAKILGEGKTTEPRTSATAEGKGEVDLLRSMATAMTPMLRRSQGLQWARDNLSFICGSFMNRRITPEQYKSLVDTVIKESAELIKVEIPLLPKFDITLSGALAGSPSAPVGKQSSLPQHETDVIAKAPDNSSKLTTSSQDTLSSRTNSKINQCNESDKNCIRKMEKESDAKINVTATKIDDKSQERTSRSFIARWLTGLFD
jgi:hypothetical protein